MLTPLRMTPPETLRSKVEDSLRRAIVSGQLQPGEKLVERELCEMLGVSRASLREALRRLEAERLIVIVPHRGPEVATVSLADARDLYALRRLLESFAAREFARLASDDQIAALARTVRRLRDAGEKKLRTGVLHAKTDFYRLLLDGCGNALIGEVLGSLLARVSLLRATSLMQADRLPHTLDEIDALLSCIQARDGPGAQRMAERHVRNAEAAAIEVLERQSDGSPSRTTSGTTR